MNTLQISHSLSCKEIAKKYTPIFSIVYAIDHLEALENERSVTKVPGLSRNDWKKYKEKTASIQEAIAYLGKLSLSFS